MTEQPTPGTFCWHDLACDNVDAATDFYSALLGWTREDDPKVEDVYARLFHNGAGFGGAFARTPETMPRAAWTPYLAVESVETAMAAAPEHGGAVMFGPIDLPGENRGRIAYLQTPSGTPVGIFEAGPEGEGAPPQPGRHAFTWYELNTRKKDEDLAFFDGLFDWSFNHKSIGPAAGYVEFGLPDQETIGGLMPMEGEMWGELPSHWMLYVQVDAVDDAAARATELGGTICVPPTDIPPVGRFSVIDDPGGATFSIIQLSEKG
ncbi:MAG: VOC family protein [Acidobacteriota bacterium]